LIHEALNDLGHLQMDESNLLREHLADGGLARLGKSKDEDLRLNCYIKGNSLYLLCEL